MIELLYRGFDGLDVSFQAQIPARLSQALEGAKSEAQKFRSSTAFEWNGVHMTVSESGARNGYAFVASTGDFGATWFFKKPNIHDPWGIRVSCNSFLLATKGLGGARAKIYATLDALEISVPLGGESIGRVDYALDFLAPGLVLSAQDFIMHSSTGWKKHSDAQEFISNGKSGRVSSVTVGKMPGRQVIVYDKRAEIIAKGKLGWWEIWDAGRAAQRRDLLVRDNPQTGAIWRVEIRAGKDDLKERWRITTWTDLDSRFGDVVAATLDAIRHASPNGDSNRSRWPLSDLWRAVRSEIEQDLLEMRSHVSPDHVKVVQREAHAQMLLGQMAGLQVALAAVLGVTYAALPAFAVTTGRQVSVRIQSDPEHFARKLADAAARYHVTD